jgi:hypothetical protein
MIRRLLRSFMFVLPIVMVLAPSSAASQETVSAAAWQSLGKLPVSERKTVLEREARREGTLVLYGATGLDRAQFWIGEFNKRYPDIKVEFVRLQAAELYQKIATERRTGQLRADLIITTITYLDLLREVGALAPYETSNWNDFDPRFRMGGADKGWTAVVYEVFPHAIAWRTNRVPAAEAPKSMADLVNPKWRGQIGTTRHMEDFLNGVLTRLGQDKGMELVKGLCRTAQPPLSEPRRLVRRACLRRGRPCMGADRGPADRARRQGRPRRLRAVRPGDGGRQHDLGWTRHDQTACRGAIRRRDAVSRGAGGIGSLAARTNLRQYARQVLHLVRQDARSVHLSGPVPATL